MDTEGNMRDLHEIAKDASAAFGDVTDLEALTAMLEDMNVRGATAFALLVQNADEFEEAVGDISNAAGSATKMADIQQESLKNQIQLVKNALLAPFLFSDEVGEANNTLNAFTHHIKELVDEFTGFFIITLPDGTEALTEHSKALKEFVIDALMIAVDMIGQLKDIFLEQEEGLSSFTTLLHMAVMPMQLMLDILERLGPEALGWYVQIKLLTTMLPIMNMLGIIGTFIQMRMMAAMIGNATATNALTASQLKAAKAMGIFTFGGQMQEAQNWRQALSIWAVNNGLVAQSSITKGAAMSWKALAMSVGLVIALFAAAVVTSGSLSDALVVLTAAAALFAIAINFAKSFAALGPIKGFAVAMVASLGMISAIGMARTKLQEKFGLGGMGGGIAETVSLAPGAGMSAGRTTFDTGGTYLGMYDSGGPTTEHGFAVLQKGETVNSKTGNMLEGGITLNTGDVHVQDGEDFANRVAEALPQAIRRVSDTGGI